MDFKVSPEDIARRRETTSLRGLLARQISNLVGDDEELHTNVPGLMITKRLAPIPPTPYLYEPSLAVIVQGEKRVILGEETYCYDESIFLLTAMNLSTITEVTRASVDKPYLSLVLKLDLELARQIITEIDCDDAPITSKSALAVGPATPQLLDALRRLFELLSSPNDIRVMSGLIQREILYRVLTSSAGTRLRQTVRMGTHTSKVARAVAWLRDNYAEPLQVSDLADRCGMGVSTFHHHFRDLTSMSPLQFQKHLRLHEARRLLLGEKIDAGSVSLQVGYESTTQFSREYRRMFGAPPLRDVRAIRSHFVSMTEATGAV